MPAPAYKRCTRCGEEKPLEAFCRDARRKDGRGSRCKPCRAVESLEWQRANPERAAERKRRWREDNPKRAAENAKRWYAANRERNRAQSREWYAQNREYALESGKRWAKENPAAVAEIHERHRRRHPAKYRARMALNSAVQQGVVTKPSHCENCGELPPQPRDLHGHHEDYSKPLEVEWLCVGCHWARHKEKAA